MSSLIVPSTIVSTSPGQAVTGNVLLRATVPAGATVRVTGVRLTGAAQPEAPRPAMPVFDPVSGLTTGVLTMRADGTFTFEAALQAGGAAGQRRRRGLAALLPAGAGSLGAVPPMYITVATSDGQSKETLLSVRLVASSPPPPPSPLPPSPPPPPWCAHVLKYLC